ncbi:hypothetical protein [Roseomonas xinghualingensis]|nr:hypothetical protein [Roseomonas sp. SXEYE001]MCV4208586.1 hypothetical protein [Roseomonas sp. SXEYE001]
MSEKAKLPPDVCDASYDERRRGFYDQMCGPQTRMEDRVWPFEEAHRRAAAEMLDEIHLMLRTLLEKQK